MFLIFPVVVMVAVCLPALGADPVPDPGHDRRTPVVRAIEQGSPAVVNIFTRRVTVGVDPFFYGLPDIFLRDLPRGFFRRRRVNRSLGSGVLVHEDGYIVTNAHVVQQGSEIRVVLADKREFDAELVTADLDRDLAIIKIADADPLPCAQLGTSRDLMIGETVIAIGNPFGYSNTVSAGIVSALDRRLEFDRGVTYEGLIQTDTAINPGNSGGALVNINGEVIGINVAIRSGAEGMGFAIPVDHVRDSLVRLLNFRNLKRLWLGATMAESRAKAGGLWRSTLRIDDVEAEAPAAKAGLRVGDVVARVGDRKVRSMIDFETALLRRNVGDTVVLHVRRDGKEQAVSVKLGEAPKPDGVALALKRLGLQVAPLTKDLVQRFRTAVDYGVLVLAVESDSPGADVGFQAGDVVIQAGTHRLATPDDLGLVLAVLGDGAKVTLRVVRGRYAVRVPLTVRGKPESRH